MSTMLAAALAYARAGLAIFPAPPGSKMSYKAARNYGGVRWGATRDEDEIRRDWGRWPAANIGLPTGRDNKIFVVETDTAAHGVDGEAALAVWTAQQGAFPVTRLAMSPSGSKHYYFAYPPSGLEVRNDTGKILGAGVDIRGEGGMVIAPPSVRSDGVYKWIIDRPPAKAPYWLIQLVSSETRRSRRSIAEDDYGLICEEYVAATVDAIATALDWHTRNNVGMAIFTATGGSARGFAIWDKWLQRSGKYSINATRQRWRKMANSPPNNIGYGTLHHLAMKHSPEWLSDLDRRLIAKMEQSYHAEYEE